MSFTHNYLSQRDPRWIDEKLGFDDIVTIGTDGAALVCLTMLVNGYGFYETPSSMNCKLKDLGSGIGFLGSLIVWPGLTRAFPKINFRRIIVCRDQPAPMDEINASLDASQPLMIEINRSPSPGLQNHWVVLYARLDNDYLMLDPWSQPPDNAPTTLINRYGYGDPPSEFITAVGWYDVVESPSPASPPDQASTLPPTPASIQAPVPESILPPTFSSAPEPTPTPTSAPVSTPTSTPTPTPALQTTTPSATAPIPEQTPPSIPASTPTPAPKPTPPSTPASTPTQTVQATSKTLTVFVSQSVGSAGLRLRSQPVTNANILAILPAGTELTSLESSEQSLPKIGQRNQWLSVRDGNGNLGYVAAGYVELENTPAPASVSLTVLVSSQASAGLRLRDRPSEHGNILEVLKPGTLLTVLEPAITAQAKIGVVNQWLNVKLQGGMTGYVAAWYVTT
jgi:hypothetical protein